MATCYDSVAAVAKAVHYLLYNTSKNGNSSYSLEEVKADDGNLLMKTLISNVNFFGVTDTISFSKGQLIHGHLTAGLFGYGDRYSGLTFRPINYNAAANEFQNWVDVGRWDTEGDWQLCDEYMDAELVGPLEPCPYPVVYNTADGKRPSDRPPVITLSMNIGLRYLFILLSAIGLLCCILIISYFVYHRASNLMKASQVKYFPSRTIQMIYYSSIFHSFNVYAATYDVDGSVGRNMYRYSDTILVISCRTRNIYLSWQNLVSLFI